MPKVNLLFQYAELLRTHKDPAARQVREFFELHEDDKVFCERASVLNIILLMQYAFRETHGQSNQSSDPQ